MKALEELRRRIMQDDRSQAEIARNAGINAQALNDFLRGRRSNPTWEYMAILAEAVDCRIVVAPKARKGTRA